MSHLIIFGQYLVFTAITLAFMYAVKFLDDRRTPFDEDKLVIEQGNIAIALRRAGMMLGIAIGMSGILSGQSKSFANDVFYLIIEGIFVSAALYSAFVINDKIMLTKTDNDKEVESGNTAVGLFECGNFIAVGLIVNGCFIGENGGILSSFIFVACAQVVLVAFYYLYCMATPYEFQEEIRNNNIAAGISIFGVLIAIGFILRPSVIGPSAGWRADIISFGINVLIAMALLLIARYAVGKILYSSSKDYRLDKSNSAISASIVSESMLVALALVISHIV